MSSMFMIPTCDTLADHYSISGATRLCDGLAILTESSEDPLQDNSYLNLKKKKNFFFK